MRCNQELYGHINCDRDVIAGEKYCKFHFVPSLRIEIEKLQAENARLRECVEFYAVNGLGNPQVGTAIDIKLTKQFYINGQYARQCLKELTTN